MMSSNIENNSHSASYKLCCTNISHNTSAIANSKGDIKSRKLKHIDVAHKLAKDYIGMKRISVDYVPTDVMPADGLTKPWKQEKFIAN